MDRLTISIPDDFAAELAAFMQARGYDNRSEALRDLARLGLARSRVDAGGTGPAVGTLSYIYNHHSRDLPKRLTEMHHAFHDLQVATLHVHLDHDNCLEVAILRGGIGAIQELGNAVAAERAVSHTELNIIPVTVDIHAHGHHGHEHSHTHVRPKS